MALSDTPRVDVDVDTGAIYIHLADGHTNVDRSIELSGGGDHGVHVVLDVIGDDVVGIEVLA